MARKTKVSEATRRALKAHRTRKANNPEAGKLAALRAWQTRLAGDRSKAGRSKVREIKGQIAALA